MTIGEGARGATGGVDTLLDVHVAAALDPLGGLLGRERFETNASGFVVAAERADARFPRHSIQRPESSVLE